MYCAVHPGTKTDTAITVSLFLLYSMPSFWVAMLTFGGKVASAALVRMDESLIEAIKPQGNKLAIKVAPKKIRTYKVDVSA